MTKKINGKCGKCQKTKPLNMNLKTIIKKAQEKCWEGFYCDFNSPRKDDFDFWLAKTIEESIKAAFERVKPEEKSFARDAFQELDGKAIKYYDVEEFNKNINKFLK